LQKKLFKIVVLFFTLSSVAQNISSRATVKVSAWGDQGDGTYRNPVLPADYSDVDAIRVGDDYYAISSTMQFSPGMVILRSKDLVNWWLVGHAINNLTDVSSDLNWDRMDRYGRGVWAGSIRYHDRKFWIYFETPDDGIFVTTAPAVEGPWSPVQAIKREAGWDDCSPLWDDPDKVYLVCTNFADHYKVHLFQLTASGREIVPGSDRVIHQSPGSEANKMYKFGGLYYHLYSEDRGPSEGRVVMMERSQSLDGPWEIRQLNRVNPAVDREPNQGGLIRTPSGQWWFLTHQGTGGHWEGRTMALLPVTWKDGWPILGEPANDGMGRMVWSGKKPVAGFSIVWPQSSDDFQERNLAPQWEWNYQPRVDKWSLAERPGFLRLYAFKPLVIGDFLRAGNTISQRAMRTGDNAATVKLDLSGMADGQRAGLCHFAKMYSWIGISQTNGRRMLTANQNGATTDGPAILANVIWLRSTWNYQGNSRYWYSLDGVTFEGFGKQYQLRWGNYRGDRIGLFTYNDLGERGRIDVDSFTCQSVKPGRSIN
jgi:beta-xylosidase